MDSITYEKHLAGQLAAAIEHTDKSVVQISKESGISETTLYRRIQHPESSFFAINELVALSHALGLDFMSVVTDAAAAAEREREEQK